MLWFMSTLFNIPVWFFRNTSWSSYFGFVGCDRFWWIWMIIVSTKNSRSEDSSQSVSICSTLCTLFRFRGRQTLKWFFRLQFKHEFPYAGYFPLGWEPLQNLHLLIISFDFPLGNWWRCLRSLLILWRVAPDWNWRISQACFRVSSATCPALMAFERVRSDSLKSLSRKALSFVPQTIISLMRKSQRFSNSHLALNFFSSEIKSCKLWPSSCLYVKNVWQRMATFFLGLQYSENLFKTGSNVIWSTA